MKHLVRIRLFTGDFCNDLDLGNFLWHSWDGSVSRHAEIIRNFIKRFDGDQFRAEFETQVQQLSSEKNPCLMNFWFS